MTTYQFERSGTAGAALRAVPRANGVLKPYSNIPTSLLTSAGYITDGTKVIGDRIETLNETIKINGVIIGKPGDEWLHVVEVGGYVVDGYTAIKHLGVSQGELTILGDVPPPVTPEPSPVSIESVNVGVTPDNKLQVIVKTKLPVHEIWVNNDQYIRKP